MLVPNACLEAGIGNVPYSRTFHGSCWLDPNPCLSGQQAASSILFPSPSASLASRVSGGLGFCSPRSSTAMAARPCPQSREMLPQATDLRFSFSVIVTSLSIFLSLCAFQKEKKLSVSINSTRLKVPQWQELCLFMFLEPVLPVWVTDTD